MHTLPWVAALLQVYPDAIGLLTWWVHSPPSACARCCPPPLQWPRGSSQHLRILETYSPPFTRSQH
jgi:hypothetical protein